jgi:hypothetical protein
LTDKPILPANQLHEAAGELCKHGQFPTAAKLDELIDWAAECEKHFDDGRKVPAFILHTILAQISDVLDHPSRTTDLSSLNRLLERIQAASAELISPSTAEVMFEKSAALIGNAREWIN